jgi:hypothetical protein
MKKFVKIAIVMSLFMIPLALTSTAAAATTESWGVSPGDKLDYTVGWNLDLNLNQSIWAMLDSQIAGSGGPTVSTQQIYNDFKTIPSVYNMQLTVLNLDSVQDISTMSSYDEINYSIAMKQTSDSSYMSIPDFLGNLTQDESSLIDQYYQNMLIPYNSSMILDALPSMPAIPPIPQRWDPTMNLPMSQDMICIPTDFSFTTLLSNFTDTLNASQWGELSQYVGISPNATDYSSFLAALGTNAIIQPKQVAIKFQLDNIQTSVLDNLINMTMGGTWNDVLTYLGISSPSATLIENLQYNDQGILQNAHFEISAGLTYAGFGTNSVTIAFDISSGVSNKMNSEYQDPFNPSTPNKSVPGYTALGLVLSGLVGVIFVAMSLKKRQMK